jgi:hypothetical protein
VTRKGATNQVCYVLTSDGQDIFANMNLISIWSLRQSNPTIRILLLCDIETIKILRKNNHQILKNVDEIHPIEAPKGPQGYRNRYIKTSMRRYVKGPFLYLDADTLIRGDLSPIFTDTKYFSAVPNHNGSGSASEIPYHELTFLTQMNWTTPEKYVNGGVLYFPDCSEVNKFSDLWHRKWMDFSTKTGKHYDQIALNSALNESCIKFDWLNHHYNAQVNARPHTAWNAVIWHIYISDHPNPKTVLNLGLEYLKQKRGTPEMIKLLTLYPHPWIVSNIIDRLVLRRFRYYGKKLLGIQNWERFWLADDYIGAVKKVYYSILQDIRGLSLFRRN